MTAVEMITMAMDERSPAVVERVKSIVVATDGSDSARAAFQSAKLIAARSGATVHVLSVLEPLPTMLSASEGMVLLPPNFYETRDERQRELVRAQIEEFDTDASWSVEVRVGRPAESIVIFAHAHKADLIIVGANKHGMVGRLFGEETAMEIARLSDVPLLVASPVMKRLPRRIIVGMDLEVDGLQCAPKAVGILADTATISCAHVKPRAEFLGVDWASYDGEYELAMRERFKSVAAAMDDAHLRPDLVVLHGDPARELSDFAVFSKAELIVVGVKRRSGRRRALGGRIASRVIRQAECSVLVVPRVIGAERHLTRTVTHPEAVSVLTVHGRDTALSVTHAGGKSPLTFQ